jgi:hypothetical protein
VADQPVIPLYTANTHPCRRFTCEACGAKQWEPCKAKDGIPLGKNRVAHMARLMRYLAVKNTKGM